MLAGMYGRCLTLLEGVDSVLMNMVREATTRTCQIPSGCWQSKKAAGSWPILQEVVPTRVEASTAAGSRFNDCNLLAFKDTLFIFA